MSLTNKLQIFNNDTVLQCGNINSDILDSNDRVIFLVRNIGNKPISMLIDTVASCRVMFKKVVDTIPDRSRSLLLDQNVGLILFLVI